MSYVNTPVFNLLFHNAAWLLCVLGRESLLWLSLPLVGCYTFYRLQNATLTVRSLLLPFVIGLSVDGLLSWLGIFLFEDSFGLIPLWLVVLWLSFATVFSTSLKFLASNWKLAVIAGAIAMPVNYLVGGEVGAVEFGIEPIYVGILLGLIWGILFPALFSYLELCAVENIRE